MKPHRSALSRAACRCAVALLTLLAAPAVAQEGKDKAPVPRDTTGATGTTGATTQPRTGTSNTGAAADSAEGAAAWTVQAPASGRWTLRTGRDYEVVVTAGDQPLTDLALVGSTLQNAETGARVSVSALELCAVDGRTGVQRDTASCASADTIPAGTSVPLRLSIDETRDVPAGTYEGDLSFAARGGQGVKPLQLKVEITSGWRWTLGALVIALGVFLSWLITVAFRQANTHYAAKLAAARLVATLADLRKRAEKAVRTTTFPLDRLLAEITALEDALTLEALKEHGLPPLIANPFGSGQDSGAAFEEYRKEKDARIQVLGVIVRTGVAGAESAWHTIGEDKRPIGIAMAELDQAAAARLELAAARTRVDEILTKMRNPQLDAVRQASGRDDALPTARELEVRIERLSLAGWGISLVLTVLVGMVVLVITNYGFGTALDYVKCLFWGMGLPFVTQKIQEVGSGGVYETLKVTRPTS